MDSFSVNNYIVRIYRYDKDNPRRLVGVVEQVGVEGKKAFHNLDELWTILSSARSKLPMKRKSEERGIK